MVSIGLNVGQCVNTIAKMRLENLSTQVKLHVINIIY